MKFSPDTIQVKLNLSFLGTTLLLMIFLTWALRSELLQQIDEHQRSSIENSGNVLAAQFQQQLARAQVIASSLARYVEVSEFDQERYATVLKSLIDAPGSSELIAGGGYWPEPYALNPEKERSSFFWGRNAVGQLEFIDDYNSPQGNGYHQEPWYVPARYLRKESCYWSPSYIDPYSHEPMVTCTVPAYKQGKFIGAATVDLRLDGIRKFVDQQSTLEGGYAFLLDQHNQFISYPESQKIFIQDSTGVRAISAEEMAQKDQRFAPLAAVLAQLRQDILRKTVAADPARQRIKELSEASDQIGVKEAEQILVALTRPLDDKQIDSLLIKQFQSSQDLVLNEAVNINIFHIPDTYWKLVIVVPQRAGIDLAEEIIGHVLIQVGAPLLFMMVVYWLLMQRFVLSPLRKITSFLKKSSKSSEPGKMPSLNANDELSQLVFWYNKRTEEVNRANAELSQVNRDLAYQANHDPLTGLDNRRSFERCLSSLISNKNWRDYALIFLDLDQFKIVNDTAGHLAGDNLLSRMAAVLKEQLRSEDYIARLGGDEFGVLLQVPNAEVAARFAKRLREAIDRQEFSYSGTGFSVTASIGLLHLGDVHEDPVEAMRLADNACFAAKDAGRNRVHIMTPDDTEIAQREGEMHWVSRIRDALTDDRIVIEYQPIKGLDPLSKPGVEVLVRLRDEEGGLVPPGAFLPAAQRYGIIDQIDRRVLRLALQSLAEHSTLFAGFGYISINLSNATLSEANFVEMIADEIDHWGVPPRSICFEVTETGMIQHLDVAREQLQAIREMGCTIALDDFGSGMSSYGYLRTLPVDIIKIDGAFVRTMEKDEVLQAFVRSMGDIARVMGLRTIAEFVENSAIETLLKDMEINYAQGYGIAKPGDIEALYRFQRVVPLKVNTKEKA